MAYKKELQKMFDLQKFGMKFGLDGILNILNKLNNPQQGLKCIHLAGTNGKGSVGCMLKSIFDGAGYNVGLYTSPHLITFRERIKIGAEMISEDEVLALSKRVWQACDPKSPPTFFEFVTVMAFLFFKEKNVDLAIIETGLGGKLDSTNVITPLVSIITNISLEHTEYLGNTLAEIASEKAGIIKQQVPVITGALADEAMQEVRKAANENNAPILVLNQDFKSEIISVDEQGRPTFNFEGDRSLKDLRLNMSGVHQADNAAVALASLPILSLQGFKTTKTQIKDGLAQASWPGRAETFPSGAWPPQGHKSAAPLLLDGAHNPAGALALGQLLSRLSFKRLHLVIGVMADKDIAGVLEPIYNRSSRLYLTRPTFSRAASPELLLEKLQAAFGKPKVKTTLHPKLPEALAAASAEAEAGDLVLLSGSLFTVGEGRAYLTGIDEVESN